jgi:hypothetical protein
MNLGKVFVQSVVREVGRSGGKVISNKVYGNAHSTPVRVVQAVESDTRPMYNSTGSRRMYRHELDRIVNGDLPGSKIMARKQLVALEGALNDFFQEQGQAETYFAWLNATEEFIENVVKVVPDEDVSKLADDAKDDVAGYRGALVDAILKLENPPQPQRKSTKELIFSIIGIVALVMAFWLFNNKENGVLNEVDSKTYSILSGILGAILLIAAIWSYASYGEAKTKYAKQIDRLQELRDIAASYKE